MDNRQMIVGHNLSGIQRQGKISAHSADVAKWKALAFTTTGLRVRLYVVSPIHATDNEVLQGYLWEIP